eukprot:3641773-Pleurochrysis_carterae.AAC.3
MRARAWVYVCAAVRAAVRGRVRAAAVGCLRLPQVGGGWRRRRPRRARVDAFSELSFAQRDAVLPPLTQHPPE